MIEEHRMIIPSELERIPDVCDLVVATARRAGLSERAVYHCQMAVDEACTNIIEHGYGSENPPGNIEIICRDNGNSYRIHIADDSPILFNPLQQDDPDPATPLEEREPGGWGIHFIKQMMDEVDYSSENGRNTLVLAKHKTSENLAKAHPTGNQISFAMHYHRAALELAPIGRLDSNTAPELESALQTQLSGGHHHLVVNMDEVSYISTSGLKVLVKMWRSARELGGTLVLTGLNPHVFEVFTTVGFDQVFAIYPTVDAAVQALDDAA